MTDARMTNAEAVMLCRMAKAACPQQQFDQYTPDMWHELLGDLRFEDARAALVEVVKSQPFVSPAEIRDQVKRVRRDRILKYGPIIPPAMLDDDPRASAVWVGEMVQRIGDGVVQPGETPETGELLAREMPDWEHVLRPMPTVTRTQIAAEEKRAKPSRFRERLEEARAELGPAAEIPPIDAPTPPDRCQAGGCQRAHGHGGDHQGPPLPTQEGAA